LQRPEAPRRQVDAVLFDLYETLVEVDWGRVIGWLAARLRVAEPDLIGAFTATREQRCTGRAGDLAGDLQVLAAACGARLGAPEFELLGAELTRVACEAARLYPDAPACLRGLRAAGVRIAVLSNCDHATRPVVDELGLAREVDAVLLSCELGSVKPDAAIFRHALQRMDVLPGRCQFVDDQAQYLDGAAAVGIGTLHIVRDAEYRPTATRGRHPVIADLSAVSTGFPRSI